MIPISYNVRNLAVRKATTVATARASPWSWFVLASALMLSEGVRRTISTSGKAENVVVLRKGNDGRALERVEDARSRSCARLRRQAAWRTDSPWRRRDRGRRLHEDQRRQGSLERADPRRARRRARFPQRGGIVEGRAPKPGTDEVMVGLRVRDRFERPRLGQKFDLPQEPAGHGRRRLLGGGTSFESEVWGDVEVIREAFGRRGVVSSARVRLESPARFEAFEAAIEQDKRLGLDAMPELEFYEKQSEGTSKFITVLGVTIAVFFSVGAMIGRDDHDVRRRRAAPPRNRGPPRARLHPRRHHALVPARVAGPRRSWGGAIGSVAALGMGFVSSR